MEREVYKFPVPAYGKRKTSKGSWRMVLEGDTLTLFDEDREEVEQWRGAEVLAAVKGPNFWESTKGYRVELDGHSVLLDLEYDAQKSLQELLDRITLMQNPDMPKKVLLMGLGMMAGGLAMASVTGIATLAGAKAAERGDGSFTIWYGGIVFGVILFIRGIMKMQTRSKWTRLAAKMEREERSTRRRRRDEDDDE